MKSEELIQAAVNFFTNETNIPLIKQYQLEQQFVENEHIEW